MSEVMQHGLCLVYARGFSKQTTYMQYMEVTKRKEQMFSKLNQSVTGL